MTIVCLDRLRRTCCGYSATSCSTTGTETPGHDVPVWSWGSSVLAATYHGLCEGYTKTEENGVLTGCPLLLQLWAYERFAVGRPMVDLSPYEEGYYANRNDDENPTMGALWLSGRTV